MYRLIVIAKYNLRSLNFKNYIVFLIICLIYPYALTLSSTIYFEQLVPIPSVFLFSNMMLYEHDIGIESPFYMTATRKSIIFLIRVLINIAFYLVVAAGLALFLTLTKMNGTALSYGEVFEENPFFLVFVLGGINYLFYGLSSNLITMYTRKPVIGIAVPLIFAFFWMSRSSWYPTFILNPYTYSSGVDSIVYKLIFLLFILAITHFSCRYIDNRLYSTANKKSLTSLLEDN